MKDITITPEEMAMLRDINTIATCRGRVVIEDEQGNEKATFPLSEGALRFIANEQCNPVSNLDTPKDGKDRPGMTIEFIENPDNYTSEEMKRRIYEAYETYGKDFRLYIKVKDVTEINMKQQNMIQGRLDTVIYKGDR